MGVTGNHVTDLHFAVAPYTPDNEVFHIFDNIIMIDLSLRPRRIISSYKTSVIK